MFKVICTIEVGLYNGLDQYLAGRSKTLKMQEDVFRRSQEMLIETHTNTAHGVCEQTDTRIRDHTGIQEQTHTHSYNRHTRPLCQFVLVELT